MIHHLAFSFTVAGEREMRVTSIWLVNFKIYSFRFDPVPLIASGISASFFPTHSWPFIHMKGLISFGPRFFSPFSDQFFFLLFACWCRVIFVLVVGNGAYTVHSQCSNNNDNNASYGFLRTHDVFRYRNGDRHLSKQHQQKLHNIIALLRVWCMGFIRTHNVTTHTHTPCVRKQWEQKLHRQTHKQPTHTCKSYSLDQRNWPIALLYRQWK